MTGYFEERLSIKCLQKVRLKAAGSENIKIIINGSSISISSVLILVLAGETLFWKQLCLFISYCIFVGAPRFFRVLFSRLFSIHCSH